MKYLFLFLSALFITGCASLKNHHTIEGVYDVACGSCIYQMPGNECQIAVQIEDKSYYVYGSGISEHGDEHADDGLCQTARKAWVKGYIQFGVFNAEFLELVPQ